MPDELELQEETLPDLKDWNEAVTRVADILGHAISKLLNASNLATLAAKLKESVTEYKADCDSLPDRLQLVMKNLGVPEAEFVNCDRVRTAKAVKTLLASCENKEPTALVEPSLTPHSYRTARRWARASSRPRRYWIACGRHDGLCSRRSPRFRTSGSQTPIRSFRMWASGSRLTNMRLAGGLASKLSDAEGRAIKLLTPPKVVDTGSAAASASILRSLSPAGKRSALAAKPA